MSWVKDRQHITNFITSFSYSVTLSIASFIATLTSDVLRQTELAFVDLGAVLIFGSENWEQPGWCIGPRFYKHMRVMQVWLINLAVYTIENGYWVQLLVRQLMVAILFNTVQNWNLIALCYSKPPLHFFYTSCAWCISVFIPAYRWKALFTICNNGTSIAFVSQCKSLHKI